ncbi:hypothetical protein BD779DRAFT_1571408 [Infundibulicybe gibba]|nr:hypothetical protein BD779DRAFT_1571408 [Infundibulicybe gibba]
MFSSRLTLLAFALALAGVHAQDTSASASVTSSAAAPSGSDTSGISPCIIQCVSQAAMSAGCTGPTDLQCVCTNTAFQTAAATCLTTTCTPADVTAAQALQATECGAYPFVSVPLH